MSEKEKLILTLKQLTEAAWEATCDVQDHQTYVDLYVALEKADDLLQLLGEQ